METEKRLRRAEKTKCILEEVVNKIEWIGCVERIVIFYNRNKLVFIGGICIVYEVETKKNSFCSFKTSNGTYIFIMNNRNLRGAFEIYVMGSVTPLPNKTEWR